MTTTKKLISSMMAIMLMVGGAASVSVLNNINTSISADASTSSTASYPQISVIDIKNQKTSDSAVNVSWIMPIDMKKGEAIYINSNSISRQITLSKNYSKNDIMSYSINAVTHNLTPGTRYSVRIDYKVTEDGSQKTIKGIPLYYATSPLTPTIKLSGEGISACDGKTSTGTIKHVKATFATTKCDGAILYMRAPGTTAWTKVSSISSVNTSLDSIKSKDLQYSGKKEFAVRLFRYYDATKTRTAYSDYSNVKTF